MREHPAGLTNRRVRRTPSAAVRCRSPGHSAGRRRRPRSTCRMASRVRGRLVPWRPPAHRHTVRRQPHPGDIRLDRWQLDAVVDLLRRLRLGRLGSGAARAGVEQTIDNAVGIGLQRATEAGTALATVRRLAGLLALRRRQRRVVRRLGRLLQQSKLRFQLSDPSQRGLQLPHQRQQREDQSVFLRHGQLAGVDLGGHPDVESGRS